MPPYHIAGIAAILSSVYAGRRVVQLSNFSAEAWLDLARRNQVTNAFVVPTMLARIVEALEGEASANLPHLRALSYGGGKMPLAVIERAMELFPDTDFSNAYGLTETSSTIAVLGPDEHRDAVASNDPALRRRLVSVGRRCPASRSRSATRRAGCWARTSAARSTCAASRSRANTRARERSGRRRLVSHPRRGRMDDDGYLFLEGRADDVIVRGGENLSPGEIEDVLLAHQAVADAAMVGIPDEQWGEAVAAAVVLKAGRQADAAALQGWVRERLRSSRVPQRIEFWPTLPYNETGKLLRRVVKTELAKNA